MNVWRYCWKWFATLRVWHFSRLCALGVVCESMLMWGTRDTRAAIATGLSGFAPLLVPALFWCTVKWWCYWLVRGMHRVTQATNSRFTLLPKIFSVVAASACLYLYLLSWGFYLRTGVFPDSDVFYFIMVNRGMLYEYARQTETRLLWEASFLLPVAFGICVTAAFAAKRDQWTSNNPENPAPAVVWTWVLFSFMLLPAVGMRDEATRGYDVSVQQHRATSFRESGLPPLSYELTKRANPVAGWCSRSILREVSFVDGTIPTKQLVPRSSVRHAQPQRANATGDLRPPNIVVIVVESLRADVPGRTHQGREVTPNINRLKRSGTVFERAYSQSVHSDYSDPCIVSSLYPLRTSGQYFYERVVPWPKVLLWDVLKAHGYSTSMFSSQNEAWSNMHLFYDSRSLDVMFDSRSDPSKSFVPVGDAGFKKWVEMTGVAGKLDDRMSAMAAIGWIERQEAANTPWMTILNFQASHFPYQLPGGQRGPFQPDDFGMDMSLTNWDRDRIATIRNAYFNAMNYVDKRIGEVVGELIALNALDRTIIVVTGDHGESMGEVGEFGHGQSLLETVCRVPLIFHCPARIAAARCQYLAQAIDIAPTLVAAVGIEVPSAFQGINLFSDRRPNDERRLVFLTSRVGGVGADAVVSGTGWKLVRRHEQYSSELYLRPTDLTKPKNLAERFPAISKILEHQLSEWRRCQLLYHRDSRFHELFYAPRTLPLDEEEAKVLKANASTTVEID